jgi:environmental stress-induced protein Ves
VSIATIAASGPFSVFAGVDRTIMLLEGDGVRLQAEGFDRRLDQPHDPFAFPGDASVDCTLLGGVSSDFNVMSRRDRCRAVVRVWEEDSMSGQAAAGLLMSIRGHWRATDELLAEGEGLWWAGESICWALEQVTPGGVLVGVRWLPPLESQ